MKLLRSLLLSLVATPLFGAVEPVELESQSIRLQGTLVTADVKEDTTQPVALLIADSGPSDRDGNNPLLGRSEVLERLAESLAAQGIASLRYDKRGIGSSTNEEFDESQLRFSQLVNDAGAWVSLLKKDKRFNKVIIIGHGEGAVIGMQAAILTKPNGLVTIAAPATPGSVILRNQIASMIDPADRSKANEILTQLEKGEPTAKVPATLSALFRPSIQPYLLSWFAIQPAEQIAIVPCPVFFIQGTNDLLVPAEHADLLRKARPEAKRFLIQDMNHVMRKVSLDLSEQLASYKDGEAPIAKEIAPAINEFILRALKKK